MQLIADRKVDNSVIYKKACIDKKFFSKIISNKDYVPKKHTVMALGLALELPLEGEDFEDVIRTAVSLGGDCDTLTDIATGMGEAFYGIPEQFKTWAYELTTDAMHEVMRVFEEKAIMISWKK